MVQKKDMTKTLLGRLNQNYVYVSNNMTSKLTDKFGFWCDLYFPRHKKNPQTNGEYSTVNLFEPHTSCIYSDEPDATAKFYIPYLLKRENVNSPDLEFDSMYANENEQRPFLESSKKDELPIQTKVVVHVGESVFRFFVDLKIVVNGASGHMLLRQYLAPLLESEDEAE